MSHAQYRSLINRFNQLPQGIQEYFKHFPKLITDYPAEICLAYMFIRIEYSFSMTLYCGVTKLHKIDASLAWNAIQSQHVTRERFKILYKQVFDEEIPQDLLSIIEPAQKTRDNIMHGKYITYAELRSSINQLIEFAEKFNDLVFAHGNFRPIGRLRGFKGPITSDNIKRSRVFLKGLGFTIA